MLLQASWDLVHVLILVCLCEAGVDVAKCECDGSCEFCLSATDCKNQDSPTAIGMGVSMESGGEHSSFGRRTITRFAVDLLRH